MEKLGGEHTKIHRGVYCIQSKPVTEPCNISHKLNKLESPVTRQKTMDITVCVMTPHPFNPSERRQP